MLLKNSSPGIALKALLLLAVAAGSLQAFEEPDRSGPGQAEFKVPELAIENEYREPKSLPPQALANATADLTALGLGPDKGRVDVRGGRWATLLLSEPLVPGQGKGNGLSWATLGRKAPKNDNEHANAAAQAFRGYLEANSHPLRIDLDELADPGKVTAHRNGALVQIYMPRIVDGVPVRGSYLSATINHGNLVLLGTHHWGDIKASTAAGITKNAALDAVQEHVGPHTVNGSWGKTELVLVPLAKGLNPKQVQIGEGFDYRLVWVIRPAFDGDQRRFEALVDAQTGQLLSFEDTNQYAEVKGGVLPVTNDGIVPDGVEQPGWPMPYADVGGETTDTGGNFFSTGTVTADFYGPYVNINDQCITGPDKSSSLTGSGILDWGTSGGTDCDTPGFGGPGNTHASRTGFYELNKVIEMARGQLPANSWLQSRLTSNMNINNSCNAFWNGTVNFYRSGGGCSNTGEIAGVFDHEWGHGMDANDSTPGIASPSGEGIADIYTALRLNDSCIGRNFRSSVCSGNGDPCDTCTGVRDIDYLARQSNQPHDYTWSNANCGGSVHCVGGVYSEAVWSLWKRELQGAPYNYDNNTAHEIVNRLTFIGAGATGTWFAGGPPYGGCAGTSGYQNFLAADDDNGDLSDGTPHMTAIFNAFNDQEIACDDLTVQDYGCAGTPTSAPIVNATASDKAVNLSWGAVAGTTEYEVFRTEGVFGCDFGKVKLGSTSGTSWNDSGLQNGREYFYVVIPKGSADACFGPASTCTTVAPAAGPALAVDTGSVSNSVFGGDADVYLDNCEDGTMTFDVQNTGLGELNNVRILDATPSNGGVTVDTSFPAAISPSTLSEGATGTGSFFFTAGGLTPGETLTFQVEVIADEMSAPYIVDLAITSTETDLTFVPSQTYSFESDSEGWTTVQGTFNRSSSGGSSHGSWYEQSSAYFDNQCDQIVSPTVVFSPTTTLSLWNNYDIEPQYTNGVWYDRANVGLVVDSGSRSLVAPDSGRTYNASGSQGTCGTAGQNGWADTADTWDQSGWSAAALGSAGLDRAEVQIDIRYGTDTSLNGYGFRFDQVTLTDVYVQEADGQPDSCDGPVNATPDVSISAPLDSSSFDQGISVSFVGTANDDEDGDISASLSWESNVDGTIGSGAGFSTSTLSAGAHTITASVTDSGGKTGSAQVSLTIQNLPPVVAITAPTEGSSFDQGTPVTFTGTADDAGDGDISANLGWTSSLDGVIGSGTSFSTSSLSAGIHTVTATATDSNSEAGSAQVSLTIQNLPPFVAITAPTEGSSFDQGSMVNFTGTADDAGDGDITANLDWTSDVDGAIGSGASVNTSTLSVGSHTITASVTDSDGAPGSDAIVITISEVAASSVHVANILTGTLNASKGSKYGTATVTVVNNLGDPVEGYKVTGDFGGSFSESAFADTDVNGVASLQTAATPKGSVTVTFCVSSVTGGLVYASGENASPTFDCGVTSNQPPVTAFTFSCSGLACGFDASGSFDPDGGSIVSYGWDFGDDITASGVNPSHSYASAGTYTVILTVTDDENDTGTDTQSVTVSATPATGMHVGDLDGSSATGSRDRWEATVAVTVHDATENPVSGATVTGSWSDGVNGSGNCVTEGSGQCSVTKGNIKSTAVSVTFTVTDVSAAGYSYNSADNEDPDPDSDGTVISVLRP